MPAPKKATDREILEIIDSSDRWVMTTAEIAEELPMSRRAALKRLEALSEEGRLVKKQVGGRNVVWYPNWNYWLEGVDE